MAARMLPACLPLEREPAGCSARTSRGRSQLLPSCQSSSPSTGYWLARKPPNPGAMEQTRIGDGPPFGRVLGPAPYELVRTRIDYTLAHASEDGYLGPNSSGSQRRFSSLAARSVLRALSALSMPLAQVYHERRHCSQNAEALSARQSFLWVPTRNVINIESSCGVTSAATTVYLRWPKLPGKST